MTKYKDHEFCKDIKCLQFYDGECTKKTPTILSSNCVHSAKDFHKWLKNNGYEIIKIKTK
jgi:hypothetical protein